MDARSLIYDRKCQARAGGICLPSCSGTANETQASRAIPDIAVNRTHSTRRAVS